MSTDTKRAHEMALYQAACNARGMDEIQTAIEEYARSIVSCSASDTNIKCAMLGVCLSMLAHERSSYDDLAGSK